MHHTQINLHPNTQFFEYAAACLLVILSNFLVVFCLRRCDMLDDFRQNVYMNMIYSFLTTMYERDIGNHTVVTTRKQVRVMKTPLHPTII